MWGSIKFAFGIICLLTLVPILLPGDKILGACEHFVPVLGSLDYKIKESMVFLLGSSFWILGIWWLI